MALTFPSDTQSGIPRWLSKITPSLFRARYRGTVGDSNAANKVPIIVQGAPSQTANLMEFYDSSKVGLAAIDSAGGLITGGNTKVSQRVIRVSLSAANIIAMFTTPVTIIPAPAAGTSVVVNQIQVELNPTSTAFASGGVVHFFYHGQTVEIMAQTLAAATINTASTQSIWLLEPVQTAGGSVVTKEVGIDITNSTGVFATGTGTAVVTVWYSLVTLG